MEATHWGNFAQQEPTNSVDKLAVAILKDGQIVGDQVRATQVDLQRLFSTSYVNILQILVTSKSLGKRVNLRDGVGLQVPCILHYIIYIIPIYL